MQKVILYFAASILLTAVFSYSLNFYLKADFITLSWKTMLIPCFTWSMLMALAWWQLPARQFVPYLEVAGRVCAWGSLALVPCGLYNFGAEQPDIRYSIASVWACVALMSALFYRWLPQQGFSLRWWIYFNVLIVINMTLFYLSTQM